MGIQIAVILVLSVHLCSMESISLCTSTVYVGADQRPEKFHSDSLDSLETDLKHFCSKNDIYATECGAIREYHTKRCFGGETAQPVHAIPTTNKEAEDIPINATDENDEEVAVRVSSLFEEIDKPHQSLQSVDYSQTHGPVLPVTLEGTTHHLKMFLGETPSVALKRFCGMLKLDTTQCTQVKVAYDELCRQNELTENESTQKVGRSDQADKESRAENTQQESMSSKDYPNTPSQQHEDYPQLLKWFLSVCEEYWNTIAFIIMIMYVATEHAYPAGR